MCTSDKYNLSLFFLVIFSITRNSTLEFISSNPTHHTIKHPFCTNPFYQAASLIHEHKILMCRCLYCFHLQCPFLNFQILTIFQRDSKIAFLTKHSLITPDHIGICLFTSQSTQSLHQNSAHIFVLVLVTLVCHVSSCLLNQTLNSLKDRYFELLNFSVLATSTTGLNVEQVINKYSLNDNQSN